MHLKWLIFLKKVKMPKSVIYERYTRLGKSNYQTYVKRCLDGLNLYGFNPVFLKKQSSDFFVHKTLRRLDGVIRVAIEGGKSSR